MNTFFLIFVGLPAFEIFLMIKLGGKIGWINENSINNDIKNALKNLEVGDYTDPILTPSGFLILKIDEIKTKQIDLKSTDIGWFFLSC